MKLSKKDYDFLTNIVEQLFIRHKINVNKDVGAAYLQPEFEDRVNPQVTISRDEIKSKTGREILRDVVIDEYVIEFNKHTSLSAKKTTEDLISVSVKPIRDKNNEFKSFSVLRNQNNRELAKDPELGNDFDL